MKRSYDKAGAERERETGRGERELTREKVEREKKDWLSRGRSRNGPTWLIISGSVFIISLSYNMSIKSNMKKREEETRKSIYVFF